MDHSAKTISKKLEKVKIYGVYEAYRSLRPIAFRKDLWMQLILWDQGGIFIDAKIYFTTPADWIHWKDEELIICGDHG